MKVCVGEESVELVPSPNDQEYELALIEVLLKLTVSGVVPEVALAVKEATRQVETYVMAWSVHSASIKP